MTGTAVIDDTLLSPHQSNDDDSVFRTPSLSMSLRGRKRKSTYTDDSFDYSVIAPKRGRPKGGTARPKVLAVDKKKTAVEAPQRNADPSGMFNFLKSGKDIAGLIDNWIKFYENEPDSAVVQLLQLFISCCGCSGTIDSNMIHTMEYKNIIPKLAEEFDEEGGDYPLVMLGQPWKKFRSNFCDFVMLFANKCKSGAIFDIAVMDNLIQLLTGMADSQLRAFRHTATFAAMKLSSAIVDIIVELVQLRDKYSIQIETETAKLKSGTNERLQILLSSKGDLNGKIDELSSMLQYMFKSVFVHRYRDVVADIRCICIMELGNWMRVYPAFFLEDSYLKYIGWSLFDKYSEVRLKCITALLTLYENENLIARLELFTNKFKERLVSMVMDIDTEVAIKTCQLMTFIYRAFPNLLDVNDCIPIYEIVYCSNRSLAMAAGEFLNAKVFTTTSAPSVSSSMEMTLLSRTNESHEVRQQLSDLVTFYVEGDVHKHASYLVDALIDVTPMLKDWPVMVEMLLNDACDNNTDTEMVDIMCCAVKQAATGELPPGRNIVKRGAPSSKEARTIAEERTRISEAFIPHLPKLLTMYIADHVKIANLTTIPLYFELYVYTRFAKDLNEILQVLDRIVEQHLDDEILRNVAKIYQFFNSDLHMTKLVDPWFRCLCDNVALQLRRNLQRFKDELEPLDEEDEAALLAGFRKMTAFYAVNSIKQWDFWDLTINLLNYSTRYKSIDLAEKAILLLFESLLWDLKQLIDDKSKEPNEESFRKVRKRRDQFLHCIRSIMTNDASGVESAYLCLCDCLIVFNRKLATDNNNELFKSLPLKLDYESQRRISFFVMDNVFVLEDESFRILDQHAQIELTYKRRNILGQYCKLIIHGVLHILDASTVLKYYIRFHNDYGDIFKILLQKCREIDRVSAAKAISQALIMSYDEIKHKSSKSNAAVDPDSDEIAELHELAKRFALSFGPDSLKNREAIAMIHKDCIGHALELDEQKRLNRPLEKPANLCFLEVLMEFSAKLVRQDKAAVLKYLERHSGKEYADIVDDEFWQPYLLYRNSLVNKNA